MNPARVIGVDFDNTIVCYDALFHKVCRERGLIPEDVPVNKSDVRNFLRRAGREDDWTEMQGYVYGARMSEAVPYPGVIEFFRSVRSRGNQLCIISHKTKTPFRGAAYDLHRAAFDWLEAKNFLSPTGAGLTLEDVHFEITKEAKIERIRSRGCQDFIDDLPEFLLEPGFPVATRRILFDPNKLYPDTPGVTRVMSWEAATTLYS